MRVIVLVMTLFALLPLPAAARSGASGQWIVATDRWGNVEYSTLTLSRDADRLTGDWDGDPVTGKVEGESLAFDVRDARGALYAFTAQLADGALRGEADFPDGNAPSRRVRHPFTARRVPDRPSGAPRTVDFAPKSFANSFSADRLPVLTVWPGDTIRTSTLDSGGMDADGKTRALFGNPQTGPFFIAGARAGDTLIVHIRALRLNRDWAGSLDSIVGRALGRSLVADAAELGKPVRWRLDRQTGTAYPDQASGALSAFRVPIRPMLGGMAVAPGFGSAPLSTGDTAPTGGNMDFPELVAGNTVYLPVQQPGALLYFGDGHARQGDGETSQYGLETSLDVEVTVELIKGRSVSMPRVESPDEIMVLGQAGSLDEALKAASTGMIQWLRRDYGLTLSQAAQVMGAAVRFSVPNLAGRSVGVAARIDKALLPPRRAD